MHDREQGTDLYLSQLGKERPVSKHERFVLSREEWLAEGSPAGIRDDAIYLITARDYMQHAHALLDGSRFELEAAEALDAFPGPGDLTLRVRTQGGALGDAAVAKALDADWDRSILPINFRLHIEPMLAATA